jgi:hypothetical protein
MKVDPGAIEPRGSGEMAEDVCTQFLSLPGTLRGREQSEASGQNNWRTVVRVVRRLMRYWHYRSSIVPGMGVERAALCSHYLLEEF